MWARFEGALRVLSFLSAARPVFLIFAPLPWILPMSARLEKLHRLICTRPRVRKNPTQAKLSLSSRHRSKPYEPRACLTALVYARQPSSDPTAVARGILSAEIALRPRTRPKSAADGLWAARSCRDGLQIRADWIEHWARAQPPTCRVKRRVDSAPHADAPPTRSGRALLPASAGCTRREDYETRPDAPRIAPHERHIPRRS